MRFKFDISKFFLSRFLPSLILTIAMAGTSFKADGRATVKASLDSSYIMMGKKTPLRLQIIDTNEQPGVVAVMRDSLPPEVEIEETHSAITSTPLGNGRYEFKTQYVVQSFDSGSYRLPPVVYVSGNDTAYSNQVTLKVVPIDVSELADINPEADVVDIESRWFDWIPDFLTDNWLWILLGLIVVGGGVCAYLILSKKVKVTILPQKKIEPPYDVAMKKLTELKTEQLWQKGQEKDFYTRLTDILREYLDRRFNINAMEMTSSQIVKALNNNEETRMSKSLMSQVLEIADFVKFAKVKPLREDNERSFDAAIKFVEDTKPAPAAVEDNDADGAGNNGTPDATGTRTEKPDADK